MADCSAALVAAVDRLKRLYEEHLKPLPFDSSCDPFCYRCFTESGNSTGVCFYAVPVNFTYVSLWVDSLYCSRRLFSTFLQYGVTDEDVREMARLENKGIQIVRAMNDVSNTMEALLEKRRQMEQEMFDPAVELELKQVAAAGMLALNTTGDAWYGAYAMAMCLKRMLDTSRSVCLENETIGRVDLHASEGERLHISYDYRKIHPLRGKDTQTIRDDTHLLSVASSLCAILAFDRRAILSAWHAVTNTIKEGNRYVTYTVC